MSSCWVCSEYLHKGGFVDTPVHQTPQLIRFDAPPISTKSVDSHFSSVCFGEDRRVPSPFCSQPCLALPCLAPMADVDAGTQASGSLVECSLRRVVVTKSCG